MKKNLFFAGALVWAAIAVAALGLLGYGLYNNNTNGSWFGGLFGGSQMWDNYDIVKEESFSLDGIGELSFDVSYHSLNVVLTDSEMLTVRQYDKDTENLFTASAQGGRLAVRVENRAFFSVGVNFTVPRLEISVPAAYAADVTLNTSSGSIRVNDAVHWGDTRVTSSSGTVRLEDIACAALDIGTSSGSIHTGEIRADSVKTNSSSGSQHFGSIESGGDITLEANSGSINGESLNAGGAVRVASSSGTQRLEGSLIASGDVSFKTTSASINCGDIQAPNCTVSSSSGTVRLGNVNVPGHVGIDTASASQNTGYVSAGTFQLSSTSGTMRLEGLSGMGSIKTSSAAISIEALDIKGDTSITSTSGTQRLALASGQSFHIEISTNSGNIKADDLALSYTDRSGDNAFGTVGDGRNGTLTIKTSSASVNIEA